MARLNYLAVSYIKMDVIKQNQKIHFFVGYKIIPYLILVLSIETREN